MFWTDERNVSYERRSDDITLRRVKTIGMIYDMTIAADPAYEQTTVEAREAYGRLNKPEGNKSLSLKYARERREREMDLNNF